jgi:hypothetical protein
MPVTPKEAHTYQDQLVKKDIKDAIERLVLHIDSDLLRGYRKITIYSAYYCVNEPLSAKIIKYPQIVDHIKKVYSEAGWLVSYFITERDYPRFDFEPI